MNHRNPARLSAALAALFPAGVAACDLREPADASLLLPEEAACLRGASPQRVAEYTGGRLCARRALAEFGVRDFSLRVGADRMVLWPDAMGGSITHTEGLCAAVVAERGRFASLGLDSEVVGEVKRGLWHRICGVREIAWLESLSADEAAAAAAMIFTAKEAFYKCQFPLSGARLGLHDLRVEPLQWGGEGAFRVHAVRALGLDPRIAMPAPGRFRLHENFASAGVAVPAALIQ